ncbi:MAG: DUF1883 domain-containing protein [Acidobacteriia bacterium]|nr:DUF1883 domain-containing protein [Terriglobia bacterium]
MQHIHGREHLEGGGLVIVHSSHQCNVLVMDDLNYRSYCSGSRFTYHGGWYEMFPAQIGIPSTGYWNVVLDLGGGSANIRYDIQYLKRAA